MSKREFIRGLVVPILLVVAMISAMYNFGGKVSGIRLWGGGWTVLISIYAQTIAIVLVILTAPCEKNSQSYPLRGKSNRRYPR